VTIFQTVPFRPATFLTMAKSEAECQSWLSKVHKVQISQLTPERREEMLRKVESSRVAEQSRQKVKACKSHALRSKALVHEGLRQMESVSAPSQFMAVQERWESAQHSSEERSMKRVRQVEARSAASEAVVLRREEEDDEDEEGLAEVAAFAGGGAPSALVAGRAGGGSVAADEDFHQLLQQLRTEPGNDDEMAAKFALYEAYGTQVEKMRSTLFGVYSENKPTLPDAVKNDMDKQLKKVDSAEAMGIPDDARGWFVYHMMAKAGKNNDHMGLIMEAFEKKLEFLAQNDQEECPICLETFSADLPADTLGCCHKVCRECWTHWCAVMHGQPFCPLCRNDEFVEALHRHVSP